MIIAFLLVFLAVLAVSVSIHILLRGRLYHYLKPASRPRRWVLFSLLVLVGVFLAWFPVWSLWPRSRVSWVLTLVFGVTFFVITMALKWFSPLIDRAIKRRGWPLR